jgi:hypothetical protein
LFVYPIKMSLFPFSNKFLPKSQKNFSFFPRNYNKLNFILV